METRLSIAPPPQLKSFSRFASFSTISVTFLLLFLVACQQEKDEINAPSPGNDGEYTMYYKILTFLETKEGKPITHPTVNPRTTYSPGDILDYVEGGMNLQYTDPRPTWAYYDVVSDTFTIPLSSGYASQQDLEDLFDQVVDSASAHFYSIAETDKFPFLYDAVSLGYSTSLMTLKVTSSVGKVHRDPTPFGSTDYWDVWGGKCGPYSGGTLDASQVMSNALNDYYSPYGCVFFTNVENVVSDNLYNQGWGAINSNDITPGDFYLDYNTYVFYCWDYQQWGDPEDWGCDDAIGFPDCGDFTISDVQCLDPTEMNFYFESIRSIYSAFINNHSNPYLTHIFTDISLQSTLCLQIQEGWYGEIDFGQPNSCNSSNYPTYLPPCCN